MLEFLLLVVATAAFGAMAVAAARRYFTFGHSASGALTLAFVDLSVAAAVTAERLALPTPVFGTEAVRLALLAAAMLSYPYLILRFVDAIEPVPRRARVAVLLVLVLILAVGLGQLAAFEFVIPGLLQALLVLFAVVWAFVHVIAAHTLWRASATARSGLARIRTRTMMSGLIGLGSLLLLIVPLGIAFGEHRVTVLVLLGNASGLALWLGYAPPAIVRYAWQRDDMETFAAVEHGVFGEDWTAPDVSADLLPVVASMVGADSAWFVHDGVVIGTSGLTRDEAELLEAAQVENRDREALIALPERRWMFTIPSGAGGLRVRATGEPVLFTLGIEPTLRALTLRLRAVLERAALLERERRAERLETDNAHTAEVARLRDDLLSTINHELRTPLVTVKGVAQLLLSRWPDMDDAERRNFVERIAENAHALHGTVEDTLTLAAVRMGDWQGEVERVRVSRLIELAAASLPADERARRVRTDIVDVEVEVDVDAVVAIVVPLLNNALKFSPSNLPVQITAGRRGEHLVLTLADQGGGLDAAATREAFEPFFRAGHVLTRETRGLGLGLTLAGTLAAHLGGRIDVATNEEGGSTFSVLVPATFLLPPVVLSEPQPHRV